MDTKHIYVNGEVTIDSDKEIPVPHLVDEVLGEPELFDGGHTTQVNLVKQSPEISRGVDSGGSRRDQGIMIGYVCTHNEEMVPHEYYLEQELYVDMYIITFHMMVKHKLLLMRIIIVKTIVCSFQNTEKEQLEQLIVTMVRKTVTIKMVLSIHCNPLGDWEQGGFDVQDFSD